ncbi:aminoglycoside phosphotransferase family protein [Aldersonia sp. NBC_00410]|uniref:aminoglycoside phosphotransferase family protein n=1 Tax=Aldersonia sp. NBC_00410 TaxID=2975954 RepID=UPI00338DA5FF
MVACQDLSRAMKWARTELDSGRLILKRQSITPWSATAQVETSTGVYWIKISVLPDRDTESKILTAAHDRRLTGVPRLVGCEPELGVVILEDVPQSAVSGIDDESIFELRNIICTELAKPCEAMEIPLISARECAETIVRTCRSYSGGWLDAGLAALLEAKLQDSTDLFDSVDASLEGPLELVHGDFHLGNILFSAEAGPIFIDWADARLGTAHWDYATYASCSTTLVPPSRERARYSLLAGLKGLADLVRTPVPGPSDRCTISLPQVREHIAKIGRTVLHSVSMIEER